MTSEYVDPATVAGPSNSRNVPSSSQPSSYEPFSTSYDSHLEEKRKREESVDSVEEKLDKKQKVSQDDVSTTEATSSEVNTNQPNNSEVNISQDNSGAQSRFDTW